MNQENTPPSGHLAGKLIVVTGAGQGIGQAYATRLASESARVALADVNAQAVNAACAELSDQGFAVEAWTVDVSDAGDVKRPCAGW